MVAEMLSEPEVDIRQDLIDCRIDICTEEVLSLWSDNFDHQTPRKDFLKDLLKNYDTNQKTVHTYLIKDHYAARVGNMPSYDKISHDIISRRAFPLSPDSNLFSDQAYNASKEKVYKEDHVIVNRSSTIESGTVIGRDTSVGAGSVIKNCVIGRQCRIGKDVKIEDSYIWDDVTVGNDVTILGAIIAGKSCIGDRCSIENGALLSFGVQTTAESTVSRNSRITTVAVDSNITSAKTSQPDPFVSEEKVVRHPGLGRMFGYVRT
jgi:translation initiation factor eIF-2B subunit epsilon